jgi:hypothetical protein
VRLDRLLPDPELGGDLLVRPATGDQAQDVGLSLRQCIAAICRRC